MLESPTVCRVYIVNALLGLTVLSRSDYLLKSKLYGPITVRLRSSESHLYLEFLQSKILDFAFKFSLSDFLNPMLRSEEHVDWPNRHPNGNSLSQMTRLENFTIRSYKRDKDIFLVPKTDYLPAIC